MERSSTSSIKDVLNGRTLSPVARRAVTLCTAVAVVSMIAASLAVVTAKRYETRNKPRLLAAGAEQGQQATSAQGDSGGGQQDLTAGDATPGDTTATSVGPAATGSQPSGVGSTPGGAPAAAAPTAGGQTAAAGAPAPGSGEACTDANPEQGIFCDHINIGGTTVLSGPLAPYGEAGLKGGQAWLNYYNSVLAPQQHIRQTKLIYYDDGDDPNKTLQFVQRMVEVDHIAYISGVTSPGAIIPYIEAHQVPFIGDIGLSPLSYKSPMVFPTGTAEVDANPVRIKIARDTFHASSFFVIEGVLPGVDTSPVKESWQKAAQQFGMEEKGYVEMAQAASDCSSQMNKAASSGAEFIFMPAATSAFLGCMRSAALLNLGIGKRTPGGSTLKGWSGGSNLQIEVDQCGKLCDGLISVGTFFNDPRTSNTPEMQLYRENMAKYAPGIDITGFIPINYYHDGWVLYNVMKQGNLFHNFSRKGLIDAANKFGPFQTGFGNQITWRPDLPRKPWNCLYQVTANVPQADHWNFAAQPDCV